MSHFARRADEFIARIRSTDIGPSTEVTAIYHCTDSKGNAVTPFRMDLSSTITVDFPGKRDLARDLAMQVHVDAIIGNINSLIRAMPSVPIRVAGGPSFPVIVQDVTLEISQLPSEDDRVQLDG